MQVQNRLSPKLLTGIIIALVFGVALVFRVALPYDQVFAGDRIKFTGIDAYYHMRIVDNLVHNFPHRITFDPYTFYPHGTNVVWPPFFDWLLAGIIWLIGLGSPSQHTVDVIGVYFPAVLGALTVIPVYFIGKELFNRWVGILAAGLIALLPGEFLGRSILGFTDHHVTEVLFTTITMLFLILAIKSAGQKQLTFNHLTGLDWAVIRRPLIYSLLAGIFLGIYLLAWVGGLLFIFIIFLYFIIQFIIEHLRGKSPDYLCVIGTSVFLVSAAISLPLLPQTRVSLLVLPSLALAILMPIILAGISRLMTSRQIKPAYYPLTLIGLGLAVLAIFYVSNPSLLKSMVQRFSIFTPSGATLTILEAQPLLFPEGNLSLSVAWSNFTTGLFLSLISLGILIYLVTKRGEADKMVFVLWSLVILAATLGQRRFAYYLAVNISLLTGYISWRILEFAGIKKLAAKPAEASKSVKKSKRKKTGRATGTTSWVNVVLGITVVFFLSFFPNISPAIATASAAAFAPNDAWCESLSWLKDNTPDPFGDPNFYYELYEPPPQGEDYKYPDSAYSIMAWWDYGHWISRIAHRVPISNPFQQGASAAARFFTAQNEASANKLVDKLDSRYIIIDYGTTTGKFHGVVTFANRSPEKFYEVYHLLRDGKHESGTLFYPEYYRSLAVRLYNFDGKQVTPQSTLVICYEERVSRDGNPYKEITSVESFNSYEEAEAHISGQESGNYRIVGDNPFISPVPLEALEHYRLIYSSDSYITQPKVGKIPLVKIFEYTAD